MDFISAKNARDIFIDDMYYAIYIKSHDETPDYENEIIANSKKKAIEIYYKMLHEEFDRKFIEEHLLIN